MPELQEEKGPAQLQLWQAQKLKINTLYYEGEQEKINGNNNNFIRGTKKQVENRLLHNCPTGTRR